MSFKIRCLLVFVFAFALSVSAVSAQDAASPVTEIVVAPGQAPTVAPNQEAAVASSQTAVVAPDKAVAAAVVEPVIDDLSIYGEVQAADGAAQTITVQYYDYDADEEKTISISCDPATKFENAASAAGMKKGDWADVTYVVKNGLNLAKNVVVEKEDMEAAQSVTAGIPETPEPAVNEE